LEPKLSEVVQVGWGFFEELTMTKSILVSLAILTLSTSAALAAHRTYHHRHAMNAHAAVLASPAQVGWTGGVSSKDHEMYMKNLHDAGYNPKNNFNANGTLKTQ
jgi:hypothetical protein